MGKKHKIKIKCKNCPKLTFNKIYCSNKCKFEDYKKNKIGAFYNPETGRKGGKIGGLIGGKNAQKTLKRLKLGLYDPNTYKKGHEVQRKNKIGLWDPKVRQKIYETHKKNKTGLWDPENRRKGGKAVAIINKKNKTGLWDPEIRRKGRIKAVMANKKNKTGFCYDKKLQSKGGLISIKILRKKKNIQFKEIYFDSYKECEIGMCIYYQIKKLKEGLNYQVKIGSKLFDFFIQNCFIEYHPICNFFRPNETNESYYKKRREVLNKNGYKDYPLIVIK